MTGTSWMSTAYGDDVDALFVAVEPILRKAPFMTGAVVTFDPIEDSNAKKNNFGALTMSLEMYAFIRRTDAPGPQAWQASINALEIPMSLDPNLKPFVDSGYSPCKLREHNSGFEIYFEDASDHLADLPDVDVAERNAVIVFRWGGDLRECTCAVAAALALAYSYSALIYSPEDNLVYSVDDLKREMSELFEELG